jgi:Ser/Thr protein kinase RdoA (MazF antagonist)
MVEHTLDRLSQFAERALGSYELLADCSWGHRMSSVLRVRDKSGVIWFLKRHGDRARYRAELTAYRKWAGALGGAAPRLHAADDSLQTMILSAAPGEAAPWPAPEVIGGVADLSAERDVQREAGRILRRLHDAQPALPWPDFAAAKVEQLDRLKPSVAALLRPRDLNRAAAEIAALADLPAPAQVPCHHDYTPRNWLVSNGTLHVIDFEWSGLDARVADFARLHLGIWASRPDLQEAFLDGYGQELSPTDREILHGCAVLTAVWLLVRAHETRQPSFEEAVRISLLRILDRASTSQTR